MDHICMHARVTSRDQSNMPGVSVYVVVFVQAYDSLLG